MKGCTGQEFDIKDKKLIIQKPKSARRDDEIPF